MSKGSVLVQSKALQTGDTRAPVGPVLGGRCNWPEMCRQHEGKLMCVESLLCSWLHTKCPGRLSLCQVGGPIHSLVHSYEVSVSCLVSCRQHTTEPRVNLVVLPAPQSCFLDLELSSQSPAKFRLSISIWMNVPLKGSLLAKAMGKFCGELSKQYFRLRLVYLC